MKPHTLNEYEEKVLLPIMIECLKTKIGYKNRVNSVMMEAGMQGKGYRINRMIIRKIIRYIRENNLIKNLIASTEGYWICADIEEYDRFIKKRESYAESLMLLRNSMFDQREEFIRENGYGGLQERIAEATKYRDMLLEHVAICDKFIFQTEGSEEDGIQGAA